MHKAQALVIHCIDFRFQKIIEQDLRKRNLVNKFDRISWAGATKDFKNVKASAVISLKLHNPDQILIYEHEDCGAYGNDNSKKIHERNAKKFANALKAIKPNLNVEILIATFEEIKPLK